MAESEPRATFAPAVHYLDPAVALDWLERAFGFSVTMRITDGDGNLVHSEMQYGGGYLMVGGEWADYTRSPRSVDGANTQVVHVMLDEDVDAHCERARAAGAVIVREPEDQFYGDRVYSAVDPEGHVWTFAQHLRDVSREEAAEASGLTIEGWT